MMLAAGTLGPETCPPAAGGHRHDWYLVPSPGDLHFWLARLLRHGRHDLARELLDRHVPGRPDPGPELTFYTGTHHPSWLWSGQVGFPLCVSYGTLRKVRQPRRGRVPWILESRGFSELSQHGRWTIPAEDNVRDVARYDAVIGGLQWAAPQDWMCEDAIIHGGTAGRVHCVATGLSVAEHQRRTVANFRELTSLWPHYSDRPCPFISVLQGDTRRPTCAATRCTWTRAWSSSRSLSATSSPGRRTRRRIIPVTDSRERKEIQAAIERLLAGIPLRSTGELTVVQLAAEAGVSAGSSPTSMSISCAASRPPCASSFRVTAHRIVACPRHGVSKRTTVPSGSKTATCRPPCRHTPR
jgi:hypothetical protein